MSNTIGVSKVQQGGPAQVKEPWGNPGEVHKECSKILSKGKIMSFRETVMHAVAIPLLMILALAVLPGKVNAMDKYTDLTVEVNLVLSDPDTEGEIRLHFAKPNNSVALDRSGGNFTFFERRNGDHPFVDHPDDWDDLYLALSERLRDSEIVDILIEYSVYEDDSYSELKDYKIIKFVDWAKSTGSRDLSRTEKDHVSIIDLSSEIQYSRRKKVAEVMGVKRLTLNKVDAHYRSLPKIVKSAVKDIGQSGLEKYSGYQGMLNKPNEGGCDEFCGWHYINTNFDDAMDVLCVGCCDTDGGDEVTPNECCPSNTDCMEARCFATDSTAKPSEYICDDNVFPHHGFKQKGRVAKVSWVIENGERKEIDKILVVKKAVGTSKYSTWETKDVEYQPKVGDLLFKHKASDEASGGSHLMIMLYDLSDPTSRQINSSGTSLDNILILEGSGVIKARSRSIGNLNNKDSSGEFWYDLYVVEIK